MEDTLSIYIFRIKGSSFYTLVQIFPEYTWVRFSPRGLVWKEKQYMKGI